MPNPCFDARGKWLLESTGIGLTCATFVLAVFQAQGLNIARLEEWQARSSDSAWKAKVIAALKPRAPEQARYLEEHELECVRYRPEEVAGAAASEGYPVGFDEAQSLGRRILDALATRYPK